MDTLGGVVLREFFEQSRPIDERRSSLAEAERWFRSSFEGQRVVLGEGHPKTLGVGSNLSVVLLHQQRFEEAAELLESLTAAAERALPAGHWQIAAFRLNLGSARLGLGELEAAEALIVENLRALEQELGSDHESVLKGRSLLGSLRERQGRSVEGDR